MFTVCRRFEVCSGGEVGSGINCRTRTGAENKLFLHHVPITSTLNTLNTM